MALADITLADSASTPVNHVFAYVGTDGNLVVRKNLSQTPDLPETLVIGHKSVKIKGVPYESHVIKLTMSFLDADGVTVRQISARTIWDIDPQIYTDARMEDLVTMLNNACTEANAKAIVKGSVL